MAHYRLFHRKAGRFFHFDGIDADDDAQALRLAEGLRGDMEAELWEGQRQVRIFAPGSAAVAGPRLFRK